MTKPVQHVLMCFLIAMLMLAMFHSASLVTWSYDLPPSALSDHVSVWAENWDALMRRLGPAHLTDALKDWFQNLVG